MAEIIIRNGQLKDISKIKDFLVNLWVMHAENEPELMEVEKIKKCNAEKYCKELLRKPKENIILVAEEDKKIAGFLTAKIKEIDSFFLHSKILYLDDIFVLPKHRRKKVATFLIKKAEDLAKEKGIKRIQARVYAFNKRMHKFLESAGYRSPYATWDKTLK